MTRFLTELLKDLFGDSLEDLFSPWLQKHLGNLGMILLAVVILGFWYSGFADFDNYASKGYCIFYLPLAGVVLALLLYAVAFQVGWRFVDSNLWLVLSIGVPFLLPLILMVWIRERNPEVVGVVALASGALLFLLFLMAVVLEVQGEWPAWAKIGLVLALLAIGYAVTKLAPLDPFGAVSVLRKYEPLGFGQR
ncbi:MAG: hypothetical protein IMF11_18720 [Proteobacteria bacterium]|nr:hypothetical protein [Pseudomonadota bacterium]